MLHRSPCKINIGLDIVRKRPDGYHDIVTAMVRVPWHDSVEVLPANGTENTLTVYGRSVDCAPEKNLVMKAAVAMQQAYGVGPLDLYLQKNIPDGAGLGGGSADAATTIVLINEMCRLGLSSDQLAAVAAGIGADCPFFIYNVNTNQPMLATGTGTILEPISLVLSGLVLAITKPEGVCISTAQAYAGVTPREPKEPLAELLKLPVEMWQGRVKNDFEESIFPMAPIIKDVRDDFLRQGAIYASMTGSGAAVYGLFPSGSCPDAQFVAHL